MSAGSNLCIKKKTTTPMLLFPLRWVNFGKMNQEGFFIQAWAPSNCRRKAFTLVELLACQPKPWRRQARSFTLIELLVVVTIISILAALLMPALKNARVTTKRVACMANMRQVGMGLIMMGDERNGWIGHDHDPGSNNWYVAVSPYLGVKTNATTTTSTLVAIQSDGKAVGCPAFLPTGSAYAGYLFYGINVNFYDNLSSGFTLVHSLNEVRSPATVFLLSEGYAATTIYANSMFDTCNNGEATPLHYARHSSTRFIGRGLNVVFVDGHAEFARSSAPVGATDLNAIWWAPNPIYDGSWNGAGYAIFGP